MTPLYLTESEVDSLVGIDDAISAVQGVGESMARGETVFNPRTRLRMKNGFLHLMPASLETEDLFGYKAYTSFKGAARFIVFLFSGGSGELLALIEGDKLGQLRTGAASAVATRILSRTNSSSLGIIGSGYQAESQLSGICAVRKIKGVKIYSRNPDHASSFCERVARAVNVPLRAVSEPGEAASSDIVVTVTNSNSPVLNGAMLRSGAHVNAVGGNMLIRKELDESVVERAQTIVIDSREQGKVECGDFLGPVEKGKLHWENILEFSDLFNGRAIRKDDDSVTLFKSQGIAPWDVAIAAVVYRRALEEKRGKRLDL